MNNEGIMEKIKDSDSSKLKIINTNPYLAMAASLALGLFGIKNKLKLNVPERIGNGYGN